MRAALLASLLAACAAPDAPRFARLRLALDDALPAGVDALSLTVRDADGVAAQADLAAPFAAEIVLETPPGTVTIEVLASVGGLPAWMGTSPPVTVTAGEVADAEVVIDPAGVLVARPLGLDLGGLTVTATAADPPEGTPATYALTPGDDGFATTLPAGDYTLSVEPVGDLVASGPLTVHVFQGVRNEWVQSFAAPDEPPPPPGVAVSLDLQVPGGRVVGGLLPVAADVVVRALDAEGRAATGYRGTVTFTAVDGLLVPALLPEPYAFTAADAGEHVFAGGLLAPVTAVLGRLGLTVTDDGGLHASVELPVVLTP